MRAIEVGSVEERAEPLRDEESRERVFIETLVGERPRKSASVQALATRAFELAWRDQACVEEVCRQVAAHALV